jgi:hypothetical protein
MAAHRVATATGVLALLVVLSACASEQVDTTSFASFREAREAGAVARGWVPAMLPESAYELRAAYEPGGWKRWGLLNFHPEDVAAVRAIVESGQLSLEGTRIDIPRRIEWWPVAMRGDLDHQSLGATGLQAYRVKGSTLVLAVNWSQGRAYYWATAP